LAQHLSVTASSILKVLAEHLPENIDDPTLIAHWPLDETEGMFAADNRAVQPQPRIYGKNTQKAGSF